MRAVMAALLISVSATIVGCSSSGDDAKQQLLLPELAGQLDDVTRVELVSAGERVDITLVRDGQTWGLAQRAGYPIKLDQLRSLLRALAQVRPVEAMTSNPEYYSRLHVTDIEDIYSDASAIRIYTDGDTPVAGVLLGKPVYRGDLEHSYMRLEGDNQSWLVRGTASVPKQAIAWLNKDVINIGRGEIAQVSIQHPDGERLVVKREHEADSSLTVQALPAGAELLYASVGNGPAEALANLRLEDVFVAKTFEWTDAAVVKTELLRRDGLLIKAKSERRQTEYFLQLQFSYAGDSEDLKAKAIELNDRHSPWVYQILPHQYQALSKRMADMLKQ